MISFPKLGNYGRLGNQLFQYAFLRVTARRLQTKFYCPPWDGDAIFNLRDEYERVSCATGILHQYDPAPQAGFTPDALMILDNTEIQGFFQSEKYFYDKNAVREWYSFRQEVIDAVDDKYFKILEQDCVSLSLRIDSDYEKTREYFPLYPVGYYKKSLDLLKPRGPVLVLADRPDLAKEFFRSLRGFEVVYVDNLTGSQQLNLMTRCCANVITNSTFAWWGAWLNSHPNKVIVAPSFWCRPGVPNPVADILCDDWIKLPGTHPVFDHFQAWRVRHPFLTLKRIMSRFM